VAQVFILDSAGRQVQSLPSVAVSAYGQAISLSSSRLDTDGQQRVVIRDAAGTVLGSWDGTHADGGFVAPGAYRVVVRWTENGSDRAQSEADLAVLPAGSALLRTATVAPNPAGRDGLNRAVLCWIPDGRTDWVRGRLYNLAGELVLQHETPANLGRETWDLLSPGGLPVSGGIYLWEVEAISNGRVVERRVLKFVVVR
jgi:hypothetical protein